MASLILTNWIFYVNYKGIWSQASSKGLVQWAKFLLTQFRFYQYSCQCINFCLFSWINFNLLSSLCWWFDRKWDYDKFIGNFIDKLLAKFSLKEIGDLNSFLGVEVIQKYDSLFLTQREFILDILERFLMENSKPTATPMSSSTLLQISDGSSPFSTTEYRQIVGSL